MGKYSKNTQKIFIGRSILDIPENHPLPNILSKYPKYDYIYWNIINIILKDNKIDNAGLVDIGANIGDTICHFRRFSDGPIWGIEPDQIYFSFLKKNTAQFKNVKLSCALASPADLAGKERFSTSRGTGATSLDGEGDIFNGARITTEDIASAITSRDVLKSDTDGYDGSIMLDIGKGLKKTGVRPPVIAFEGPTKAQTKAGKTAEHIKALTQLQQLGYRVHILTNTGDPVATVGTSARALTWQMEAHQRSFETQQEMCPYFDFICVAPGLGANALFYPPRIKEEIWKDVRLPAGERPTSL